MCVPQEDSHSVYVRLMLKSRFSASLSFNESSFDNVIALPVDCFFGNIREHFTQRPISCLDILVTIISQRQPIFLISPKYLT